MNEQHHHYYDHERFQKTVQMFKHFQSHPITNTNKAIEIKQKIDKKDKIKKEREKKTQ